MEFITPLFGKVIDITASFMVGVALHVPFLMQGLLHAPVIPYTPNPHQKGTEPLVRNQPALQVSANSAGKKAEAIVAQNSVLLTYTYPSLDGAYNFTVHGAEQEGNCTYEVTGRNGEKYILNNLIGFDQIYCFSSEEVYSSFAGWVDSSQFIISENYRNPRLVNVSKRTVTEFAPVGTDLIFRNVDPTLEYWIFQEGPEGKFLVFNRSMVLMQEIENKSYWSVPIYDPIHKAFLFAGRTEDTARHVSVRFDLLRLQPLGFVHLLTTTPTKVRGRECTPSKFISASGTAIVISPGCLTVDAKYLKNGNIEVPVPPVE